MVSLDTVTFEISGPTVEPVTVFIKVDYTFNGAKTSRTLGNGDTIQADDGTSISALASLTASEGSISDTPPDLATWYFKEWAGGGSSNPYVFTASAGLTKTATYTKQSTYNTRSPTRRATKMKAKTDEEVAALRTTALKELQKINQHVAADNQVRMETTLGTILCDLGIVGNSQHHYRNFSQELLSLKNTFTSTTLNNEARQRAIKWKGRGLTWTTLQACAQLQGIDIGTTP